MELKELLLWIIASILVLNYLLSMSLSILNLLNLSETQPDELKQYYDEERYKKSQQYEREKSRFGMISETVMFIISFFFLILGGYGWLDGWVHSITTDLLWSTLLFFGTFALFSDLLSIPFSLYSTFRIEARYGFNKTTLAVFISDRIKGYFLAGALGGSLLALFVLFYQYTGSDFWIYMLAVFAIFMVVLNMFYTSLILPLFNKLTPLAAGEVRTAIENYCHENKFEVANLYVMDGSRRSSKANAFFSGLGGKKKIVLFDTLVNNYSKDELVAVLAHEVGHYKKKHTLFSMIFSILQTALMLWLLSVFINNEWFICVFHFTK